MAVSYAQAAKGATYAAASRSSSSKVTSGAATPANDAPAEVISSGNWADDVEASVGEKASSSQMKEQDESQAQQPKDSIVERTKVADKAEETPSGISSPDLAASASSTTKEDDSTSAQNGASSESTWDTKSQTSEPSWITERKLRQDGLQSGEAAEKNEKKSKENALPPPPKPPVLHEAAPPSVNIWAQRMAMKAAAPKPASTASMEPTSLKENQRPSAPRRQASSVTGVPREAFTPKDGEAKKSNPLTSALNGSNTDSPVTNASKSSSTERASEKSHATTFSSVKDDVSWPTPENVADKERKSSAEKEPDTQRTEDTTPAGKKGKQQWQPLPVTPQYVPVELGSGRPRGTPGDKSNRPSNGTKRGPPRGSSNPTGSNDRERETSRSTSTPMNGDTTPSSQKHGSLSEDTNTTPVPSKPTRSSSTGPRGPGKKDMLPTRKFGRQPTGDSLQVDTANHEGAKQATSKDTSFDKSLSEPRRNRSPKKMSPAGEKTEADSVPKPIPRRNSAGTQTDDVNANAEGANRDAQAPRPNGLDQRKESRTSEAGRDSNYQGRGTKRNGRGRGGAPRDFTNGHTYMGSPNGFGTDFSSSSPYAAAQSPGFPTPRGNHQFSYPPPRGGGSFRGNPRSQSIPVDNNFYNQNGRAGYPPYPIQGMPTFMPGMYDVNGYPVSAMPYTQQMEADHLMQTVTMQVEYYFSVNNLIKDMFLRKHMDSQGFVFLDIIANFNRIKQLTQDREILKAVCHHSQIIEIVIGDDQKERVRKREGWEPFCLPIEQREPSAQTTGPERLQQLERPQLSMAFLNQIPPQFRGPASAGLPNMHQRYDRRSYDSAYGMANGYPPQFATYPGYAESMYHESMNGDEPRGRAAKSPIHESVTSPTEQPLANVQSNADSEPDAFPDADINNLTLLVKSLREDESNDQPQWHSASSRTFSNGSIDSRSIMEMSKPSEAKSSTATPNGEPVVNGTESKLSLTRTLSPSKSQAHSSTGFSAVSPSDVNVFWVKEPENLGNLPPGLASESYFALRHRALEDRNRAVTGNCPYDLDVLYHFWSHFLLRNFNSRMYTEFKDYANHDAQQRYCFKGLKHLIQFFSQSLNSSNPIRDRVVKDYVALVENEPAEMEGAAFKSLRSAWRNGALNLKNRKKLTNVLSENLKEQLDRVEA